MTIKNIIFDLGGVILNINNELIVEAFSCDLGVINFKNLKNQYKEFFEQFEKGNITPPVFRSEIRKICDLHGVSDDAIDEAWNATLFRSDQDRHEFVERLAFIRQLREEGYRVFLFSNTNAIHLTTLRSIFNDWQIEHSQENHRAPLKNYFEKEYYSHLIHTRKPEAQGFLSILHENKLEVGETLFIDDMLINAQGAKEVGLHALYLDLTQGHSILTNVLPYLEQEKNECQSHLRHSPRSHQVT